MNVHKNAPLTPKGREAMVRGVVEGGLSQADAAATSSHEQWALSIAWQRTPVATRSTETRRNCRRRCSRILSSSASSGAKSM